MTILAPAMQLASVGDLRPGQWALARGLLDDKTPTGALLFATSEQNGHGTRRVLHIAPGHCYFTGDYLGRESVAVIDSPVRVPLPVTTAKPRTSVPDIQGWELLIALIDKTREPCFVAADKSEPRFPVFIGFDGAVLSAEAGFPKRLCWLRPERIEYMADKGDWQPLMELSATQ